MGEYIAPFDLKTIFMDYLLGSPELVIFALLVVISYACAYFNMSNKNFAFILVIGALMFTYYLGQAWYFIIIVILGFILFKGIGRFFT